MPTIYTTTSWKFHTASKKVKVKCSKCEKTIIKTVSVQYREDSRPDYELLEQKKQKVLQQKHICNKCEKASIEDKVVYNTLNIEDELKSLIAQVDIVKREQIALNTTIKKLEAKLNNKIIKYNNIEYVYNYIIPAEYNFKYKYIIFCNKVNSKHPWLLTDKQLNIYSDVINIGKDWCSIKDVTITEEDFSSRKVKHDKAI